MSAGRQEAAAPEEAATPDVPSPEVPAPEPPAPAAARSSEPVSTPAPEPTAVMPAVPPAAAYAPPQYAPPPQYAQAPQYSQPAQYGDHGPAPQPPKKKTGLIVAIVIIATLLLCCLVAGIGGYLYYRSQQQATPTSTRSSTSGGSDDSSPVDEVAEIEEAEKVVEAYYAAVAAADMDEIDTLLAASVAEEVGPDWYEGWDPTTAFEYTRGILDGDTITIYGRESVQTLGSGEDGGVKFTLVKEDGRWRISGWAGADRAEVDGVDPSGGSSSYQDEPALSEESAERLVVDLLEARRAGDTAAIQRLTTSAFQSEYGVVWLDGIPTAEYFTDYRIEGVTVSGGSATVTVSEDWISGTETATYEIVTEGGALLVDTWESGQ